MDNNHYENFKTQQKELQRRAENYRLIKSVEKNARRSAKLYDAIGHTLIQLGQQLLNRAQAAH